MKQKEKQIISFLAMWWDKEEYSKGEYGELSEAGLTISVIRWWNWWNGGMLYI
ncbi:MAG: hypothetical protein ACLUD1_00875 [Clostridia bacterium]